MSNDVVEELQRLQGLSEDKKPSASQPVVTSSPQAFNPFAAIAGFFNRILGNTPNEAQPVAKVELPPIENPFAEKPPQPAAVARLLETSSPITFAGNTPSITGSELVKPPTAEQIRANEIKDLLTISDPLSLDQVGRLQTLLNEDGHDVGKVDRDFRTHTAAGVVGFLKDHPEMAHLVSSNIYETLINHDPHNANKAALRELVASNPEFKAQLVESTKTLLGTPVTAMNDEQRHTLQTNLSLLGHYNYDRAGKLEIDGKVGGVSLRAIAAFAKQNDLDIGTMVAEHQPQPARAPVAPPKPTEVFALEANKPQISMPTLSRRTKGLNPEAFLTDDTYGISREAILEAWRVTLRGETAKFHPEFKSERPIFVGIAAHNQENSRGVRDPGAVSPFDETLHEADINRAAAQASVRAAYGRGFNSVYVGGEEDHAFPVKYNSNTLEHIAIKGQFAYNLGVITGAPVMAINHETNIASDPRVRGARTYAFTNTPDNAKFRPAVNERDVELAREVANSFTTGNKPTAVKTARHMALRGMAKGTVDSGSQDFAATTIEVGYLSNRANADELRELRDNPTLAGVRIINGVANFYEANEPRLALSPRMGDDQTIQVAVAHQIPTAGIGL